MIHALDVFPTMTADGAQQMALDEVLLGRAERGRAGFRLYFWDRPTLSLGYFQPAAQRACWPALESLPVVRRMTGGGAIVHGQPIRLPTGETLTDCTYALALPASEVSRQPPCRWHDQIHQVLCAVLQDMGIAALMVPRAPTCTTGERQTAEEAASNDKTPPRETGLDFLCFARAAPGDGVWQGQKIIGSAQRLRRGALLQHGSIFLPHWPCSPETLAQLWLARLGWEFVPTEWSREELEEAEQLAENRYRHPAWTFRR